MTTTINVLTKAGTCQVKCEVVEKSTSLARAQKAVIIINECHVGTYHRLRFDTSPNWLPWVDADFTHKVRSLRDIARFWAE